MQDPSSFYSQQIKSQAQHVPSPQFPDQERLKCPRCDSTNTKFCYYNNYNLSQPRHYCKSCRRYWTKGGVLRNIPVGGGSRKNNTKRSSRDSGEGGGGGEAEEPSAKRQASTAAVGGEKPLSSEAEADASSSSGLKNDVGHFGNLADASLSTLMGSPSGGHFGNYAGGLGCFAEHGSGQNVDLAILDGGSSNNDGAEFLNVDAGAGGENDGGGDERWSSGQSNGWSGHAMYTPDSAFHH